MRTLSAIIPIAALCWLTSSVGPADMTVSVVLTAPPPPAAAIKGEASKLLSPEAKQQNSGDGDGRSSAIDKPVLHIGRGSPLPSALSGSPSARLRISDIRDGAAVLTVCYTDPAQLPGAVQTLQAADIAPIPIATYRLEMVDRDVTSQAVPADDDANADDAGTEKRDAVEVEVGFSMRADLSPMCVRRNGPLCEIIASRTAAAGVMNPDGMVNDSILPARLLLHLPAFV